MGGRGAVLPARRPVLRRPGGRSARSRGRRRDGVDAAPASRRRGQRGADGRRRGSLARGRDAVGRRDARRTAQQAGLPRPARCHGAVDQPGAQAGRAAARGGGRQLSRLRHAGLPRRRPAVRRRRRPARAGGGRARGRVAGDPGRRPEPRGRRVRLRPQSFRRAVGRPRVPGRRLADPGGLVPFTPEAAAAAWPDGAVHPAELHPPESFTRPRPDRRLEPVPRVRRG